VPFVVKELAGSDIAICTVVGFPLGASRSATKAYEANLAVKEGADEIDMVINIGALKGGLLNVVADDIATVRDACQGKILKVIIETAYLSDEEKRTACRIAAENGADFVKTSTGFAGKGAMVEDVKLMVATVGPKVQVKAAGGIKTKADALKMIEAGATRLGTSAGIQILTE
jgi:deoxyribose-phosphate aldolase